MKLRAYLLNMPVDQRERWAAACGTSLNYLWRLAYNFDKGLRPSAELATQIEIHSNQMVRRWESIPETWHRIWPELIGLPGAPSLQQELAVEDVA
ncbi:MAG: hypothetical protein EOP38_15430 [Rubrivivax sp.]|nr:MAG: hypothetical protein EOP38_15430 [Rubrivivax sp.]